MASTPNQKNGLAMPEDDNTDTDNNPSRNRSPISITGLAGAAGWSVCLCSLTGFLGGWFWVFDLTAHFRIQYFFLLLLAAVAVIMARQFKLALVFTAFAVLNGLLVLPLMVPSGNPPGNIQSPGPPLKLVSLNLNSRNQNVDAVAAFLKSEDPDLLLLMEFNDFWDYRLRDRLESYPVQLKKPRNDNFGIALFSRPILASNEMWLSSGGARLPSIHAEFHREVSFHLLGTHPLPPAGGRYSRARNAQLKQLADYVSTLNGPVILAGDLNLTPWSPHFTRLLSKTGLKNGSDGHGPQWTWPAFFPPMGIPIDHFLHSEQIRVLDLRNGPDVGSDHLPVIVEFQVVVE